MNKMRKQVKGFTLVEILIVVIILGILAAIVIPQFTEASTSAKESSLTSNLQTLRSQVGLFKIQHGDLLPGGTNIGGVITDPATSAAIELALTTQTGDDGQAGTKFGPYMQAVPENPFITDDTLALFEIGNAVAADTNGDGVLEGPATGNSHWYLNFDTGAIYANDGGETPEPVVPHAQL